MAEPVDEMILTSTSSSSLETPPIEREIPLEDWVTNDVLDSESPFSMNCSDVHTVLDGLVGATLAANNWVVSIPEKEEQVCSTYQPKCIPLYKVIFRDMVFCFPFTDFRFQSSGAYA